MVIHVNSVRGEPWFNRQATRNLAAEIRKMNGVSSVALACGHCQEELSCNEAPIVEDATCGNCGGLLLKD